MDWLYRFVEHWSSKLNVWSWNKRWRNREEGTGYHEDWIKGYKKWRKKYDEKEKR